MHKTVPVYMLMHSYRVDKAASSRKDRLKDLGQRLSDPMRSLSNSSGVKSLK